MTVLGITLLFLGVLVLAMALRGRVTARGRFCRTCRFDLAGLTNPSACPECGRTMDGPGATRSTLRAVRRWPAAFAAVLLVTGGALTAISASGSTARLVGLLPDRALLTLSDFGVDDALTELSNRVTGTGLPDDMLDRLAAEALELQADASRAWDPRHGEFLAFAWISGRLSDEQLGRYIENSADAEVVFPEYIRHGAESFTGQILQGRGSRRQALNRATINPGQPGAVMIWERLEAAGVREPEHRREPPSFIGGQLTAPGTVGQGGGFPAIIPMEGFDWTRVEAGTDLTFFVTLRMTAIRETDNKQLAERTVTLEQTVRVLSPDEPLVRMKSDPETIDAFRNDTTIRVTHAHIPPPEERSGDRHHTLYVHAQDMPMTVSGPVYALTQDGEVRISRFTMPAQPAGMSMLTLIWRPLEVDDETAVRLLEEWRAAGSITIEIRPDPLFAEKTAGVREILGVPIRFENVPVTDSAPPLAMQTTAHPSLIPGRPITDDLSDGSTEPPKP
jgi:hypothetical protein